MAQDEKLTGLHLLAIISILIAVVVITSSVMFMIIYPEHKANEKFDEGKKHFDNGMNIYNKAVTEIDLGHYEEAYQLYSDAKYEFRIAYLRLREAESFSDSEEFQRIIAQSKKACLDSSRMCQERMDYCLFRINFDEGMQYFDNATKTTRSIYTEIDLGHYEDAARLCDEAINGYQHAHYYFCKAEEKVPSEDYKNQEAISEWKEECEKCIDALEKVKSKTYELIYEKKTREERREILKDILSFISSLFIV